jgi:hypothetical protein
MFLWSAVDHRNQNRSFKKDTDDDDISRYGRAIIIFF